MGIIWETEIVNNFLLSPRTEQGGALLGFWPVWTVIPMPGGIIRSRLRLPGIGHGDCAYGSFPARISSRIGRTDPFRDRCRIDSDKK